MKRFKSAFVIDLLVEDLDDEGVVNGFVSDGRFGAVPGVDLHLVAQRDDAVEDRPHDPRVVAARQVGAADRLAEERVAREEALRAGLVERHVAGRVAGRGDDLQHGVAEAHFGRRVEVDVGHGERADRDAEDRTAGRGAFDEEAVLEREGERNVVAAAQVLDAERVVEVPVGVDGHDGPQPVFGDEVVQRGVFARGAVAGVDDDALQRVVPKDIGVLLDRIEREAGDFHSGGLFAQR